MLLNEQTAVMRRLMHEKTVAEQAYRVLRDDLVSGQLEPGRKLRVNELQTRYGLGLSPLREGLLRLASEGLVTAEGHRGFAASALTLEGILDVIQARQEIEASALKLAIIQGDEEWESGVVASYHVLSRTPVPNNPADVQEFRQWEMRHRQFHTALLSACRSTWIMRFYNQLMDHSERFRWARHQESPTAEQRKTKSTDHNLEHLDLMQAALDRDIPRAQELMRAHLQQTAEATARQLQQHLHQQQKKLA